MHNHSTSVEELSADTARHLSSVLCRLGHCCDGPCDLLSPALGTVWFTWQREGIATTLVVLESNDSSALSPLVHAVNSCARDARIRIRTRGIDDRGRALSVICPTPLNGGVSPRLGGHYESINSH